MTVSRNFLVGTWLVEPSLNAISRNGTTLHLEPKVMEVLVCLAEQPGELLPREKLFQTVWPDTFVSDDVLKRAISELRRVFEDDAHEPRVIQTIPKRGYRLVAPVGPGEQSGEIGLAATRTAVPGWITGYDSRKRRVIALTCGAFFVVLTVVGIAASRWWWKNESRPAPGKIRLLVLPFANLSGDPGQSFFSAGLTDELITQLGQLNPSRLGVIASTSSNIIRDKPISEISRTLNVQYVVEGSVRRSGNQVRIDVQLVQASDETHIWANSYTRDLTDVLRVQSEVSEAVARQIPANLHLSSLPAPPSVNPEAHDAYLKAKLYWNSRTDIAKSVILFEEAVRDDPNYAAAYAGLANAYVILGDAPYDGILPREANAKARSAAKRALELDPSLAEAHAALGNASVDYDYDLGTAEREYRLALELNPNDPSVHEWLGIVFLIQGKTKEALEEARLCLDFDPVSPAGHTLIAEIFYYMREYDKTIEEARRILEVHPYYLQARYFLGSAYLQKKMYAEAIEQFRVARQASGDNSAMVMAYGHAQALAGSHGEALAALQVLETRRQKQYVPAVYLAGLYVGLNDLPNALKYMNLAYEERDDRVVYWRIDPMVDPLRSDPEFQSLLHKIASGVPPAK